MDTATHFVIGVSLAGLATIDPVINQDPSLIQPILIGTIVGSQAPDFDSITRMFGGTSSYVRNHRGITHSIPFILLWPTIISFVISLIYPNMPLFHLWLWTFIAVFFHVFLDIFNAYGTQALLPFSSKWLALNVINIFDPFIFITHVLAISLWSIPNINTKATFIVVYLSTFLYIGWRTWIQHNLLHKLPVDGKLTLLPTIKWSTWNLILETEKEFRLGLVKNSKIEWIDTKKKLPEHQCVIKSKQNKMVQDFLYFTSYSYPVWEKNPYGYEVRWIDLRYRFKEHYPFLVIVLLNESYQIKQSYIGWIYTEKQIQKKLIALLAKG